MYRNDVDEKLIPAFDWLAKGDVIQAENIAHSFLNSPEILLNRQAHLLVAACKIRKADYADALRPLMEIDTWENKEALGSSAICLAKLGKIADAEVRFNKAISLEKGPHGYLTHGLVLSYLQALIEAGAFKFLEKYIGEFIEVYASLGITDPTFLIIREIPPIEEFLIEVKKAVQAGYSGLRKSEWLVLFSKLDDDGKIALKELFLLAGWDNL